MHSTDTNGPAAQGRLTLFDDRYGTGAHQRLLERLAQPCASFAEIAEEFGVTRERVRQWHAEYLPGAPKGQARRRLCMLQQARRKVLTDPLFRAFYRHARSSFAPGQLHLIRAHAGFRTRLARLNGYLVAVKRARRRAGRSATAVVHVLTTCRRDVDFVYYQLDDNEFLFVPTAHLPGTGTTFLDAPASKYQQYRNTFAAATRPATASTDVH